MTPESPGGLDTIQLIAVGIQAGATLVAMIAAIAAWIAVRHARRSAIAARESVLFPAKHEHTKNIQDLLIELLSRSPLNLNEGAYTKEYPSNHSSPADWKSRLDFNLESRVLFDDVGNHISGFHHLWDEMISALIRHFEAWSDITNQLIQALTDHLGLPFTEGDDIGWKRDALRSVWAQLYNENMHGRELSRIDDLQVYIQGSPPETFTVEYQYPGR